MGCCGGQDPTGKDCDFHKSLELYRTIAAMALLCCGTVYFLGGILCFGLIKRCELPLRSLHPPPPPSGHAHPMSGVLGTASPDASFSCFMFW